MWIMHEMEFGGKKNAEGRKCSKLVCASSNEDTKIAFSLQ